MDAQGFVGISCKLRARRSELPQAATSKVSRSRLFLWKSRRVLKVTITDFGKLLRSGFEAGLYLITQSRKRRSRSLVLDDPLPNQISAQFRQNSRKVFRQPLTLARRQSLYGLFNFGNSTHRSFVISMSGSRESNTIFRLSRTVARQLVEQRVQAHNTPFDSRTTSNYFLSAAVAAAAFFCSTGAAVAAAISPCTGIPSARLTSFSIRFSTSGLSFKVCLEFSRP